MKRIFVTAADRAILKVVVENAPQGDSMSISDVRQSIRLLDLIEQDCDVLQIEDADHAALVQKFSRGRFIRADRSVLALFDKLTDTTNCDNRAQFDMEL